jgi:hypothetical protein
MEFVHTELLSGLPSWEQAVRSTLRLVDARLKRGAV